MTADSDALRQRRRRAHKAGDHSLCAPSRCGGKLGTLKNLPEAHDEVRFTGPRADGEPENGVMTELALGTVAALAFADDDPRFMIGYLIVEMSRTFDDTHSPALAKEIVSQLRWLVDHAEGEKNELAAIKARAVRKQADILIAYASSQVTA
jgi:hypothetical protein